MNKDEILQKAKQEKKPMDEMELEISRKSDHVAIIVGLIISTIFMTIKMAIGLPYKDIFSLYGFMLAGQYIYKSFKLKDKTSITCAVCWSFVGIVNFIIYLFEIF